MKCQNCNKEIEENLNECPYCQHSININSATSDNVENNKKTKKVNKKNKTSKAQSETKSITDETNTTKEDKTANISSIEKSSENKKEKNTNNIGDDIKKLINEQPITFFSVAITFAICLFATLMFFIGVGLSTFKVASAESLFFYCGLLLLINAIALLYLRKTGAKSNHKFINLALLALLFVFILMLVSVILIIVICL